MKEDKTGRECITHGVEEVGKKEGKRPVGRRRLRWKDTMKMGLTDIGWSDVKWIHPARDRDRWWALENMAMNLGNSPVAELLVDSQCLGCGAAISLEFTSLELGQILAKFSKSD